MSVITNASRPLPAPLAIKAIFCRGVLWTLFLSVALVPATKTKSIALLFRCSLILSKYRISKVSNETKIDAYSESKKKSNVYNNITKVLVILAAVVEYVSTPAVAMLRIIPFSKQRLD